MPKLSISPPLLNSASPWATSLDDLKAILHSASTGAITTRTSVFSEAGFDHQPLSHRYVFFDVATGQPHPSGSQDGPVPSSTWTDNDDIAPGAQNTLNSLGYSPHPLSAYLDMLRALAPSSKTAIVSVTGSPEDVRSCYDAVVSAKFQMQMPLALEINLSCPNIPGRPPPAYSGAELSRYLEVLSEDPTIPIGVKTPPFTHDGQFREFVGAVAKYPGRLAFVTATNTLGSCLVLGGDGLQNALPSEGGLGGMAGPALHPLALGNVRCLRRELDAAGLEDVDIIGVGGVSDADGYRRMRAAGAKYVALASGLGRHGAGVFEQIEKGLDGKW